VKSKTENLVQRLVKTCRICMLRTGQLYKTRYIFVQICVNRYLEIERPDSTDKGHALKEDSGEGTIVENTSRKGKRD